jgi:hypothetical protein
MTVIAAAITKKHGVVLVSDSEIDAHTKDTDGYSKVWVDDQNLDIILGGAGTLRELQIIKHHMIWPYYPPGMDPETFVVKEIVPRMRETLIEHGAKMEDYESCFIVAWDNTFVIIDESFAVSIPASGRFAVGSGQSEALGSLGNEGPWTRENVIEAARRATITALGVGGPLWAVDTLLKFPEKV